MKKTLIFIYLFSVQIITNGQLKDNGLSNKEMLEVCNLKLQEDSNDIEWRLYRATTYINLQYYKKAEDDFLKVVKIENNNSKAYYGLGLCYYYMKEYEKSLENYSKSLEIKQSADTKFAISNVYIKMKKYRQAITNLNELIIKEPNYVDAYNNRGVCYLELKEFKLSIKDFSSALKINPNQQNSLYNRGYAYFLNGELDKAINDLKNSINKNDDNSYPYYYLGIVYFSQGLHENGCIQWRKAKELKHNFSSDDNYKKCDDE